MSKTIEPSEVGMSQTAAQHRQHQLTSDQIVQRMLSGDVPVVRSSFSQASEFDDGTHVPHQVMQRIAFRLQLSPPQRGQRWAIPQLPDGSSD